MANGARAMEGKLASLEMNGVSHKPPMKPSLGKRTFDEPGLLTFTVARTPMDNHANGMGCAATAALILRSLARTASATLDRSGLRNKPETGAGDAAAEISGADGAAVEIDGVGDRFGLPLPPSDGLLPDTTALAAANARPGAAEAGDSSDMGLQHAEQHGIVNGSKTAGADDGAQLALGGSGPPAADGLHGSALDASSDAAALRLIDALVTMEEEMMLQASENDVLCKLLNDVLMELRPQLFVSMLDEDDIPS